VTSYARDLGIINDSMTTLTQNRRIGRSFQELVQRSMAYQQENGYAFTSPARSTATGGSRTTVRPDFTERVTYFSNTGTQVDPYGSFVEVKATGAVLNPSYYYYQILGHIDAVSRRPASGFFRGAARVLFITTSDTSVGTTDTLREANNRGVGIWKAIVCRTTPNSNSFQVSPAVPLNPGIYSQTPVPGSPGLVTGLSQPGTTPAGY
jgi:hypothetical protein